MSHGLLLRLRTWIRRRKQLPPMPIIVGAPRSGTTLLRLMLDAHPALAIPPETGFLILGPRFTEHGDALREAFIQRITHFPADAPGWADFGIDEQRFRRHVEALEPFTVAEGYRTFYRLYAERAGKPRWGDKTPAYALHLGAIEAMLPEARFIHIIRDGRDVALSLRRMWFAPGQTPEALAEHWCRHVQTGRRLGAGCRHYLEIRYETLLREPAATLRAICAHIELDFDSRMLDYHHRVPQRLDEHKTRLRADGSTLITQDERREMLRRTTRPPDTARIGRWRTQMSEADQERFLAVAGPLLGELGYLSALRPERRSPNDR